MLCKISLVFCLVQIIFADKPATRSGFCKANAEYICGPEREVTCDTYYDDIAENAPCVEKCHCEEGFAKNALGYCIPYYDCPLRRCPVNANYDKCGPSCQRKCLSDGCQNDGLCHEGCFCRLGYVLDDEERRCIKQSECPRPEDHKPGKTVGNLIFSVI